MKKSDGRQKTLGISRRDCLQTSALALGAALFPGAALSQVTGPGARPAKPNIVFILADDLGYADLSCYGRTEYETPNIDRLAREGTRFTQAYANSAVCSATRTALMTGRYQYRLPLGLEEPLAGRDVGLPPDHPTLPSLLREAGYGTTLLGKWHLGELPKYGPLKSGYDHFWGLRGGGVDYFTHEAGGALDLWDDERLADEPGYLTDLIGDHTVSVIDDYASSENPFFVSVHFTTPHWPWQGPDDEAESKRLAARAETDPAAILHYDGGSMETFAAMVTRMDFQVGRILEALDRNGLAENTIVVFTSDNGGERYSNVWPFSGTKTELLEGGLRIPSIIRWPGKVEAGRVSEQVSMTMDWMPTLLQAAGTEPNHAFPSDGMSLLGNLTRNEPARSRTVFWRYHNLNQEACRSGKWKYLKILDNTFLFDVEADPLERANLKERFPDTYDKLVAAYDDWNATMLPVDPEAFTMGPRGSDIADHFGIEERKTVLEDK